MKSNCQHAHDCDAEYQSRWYESYITVATFVHTDRTVRSFDENENERNAIQRLEQQDAEREISALC